MERPSIAVWFIAVGIAVLVYSLSPPLLLVAGFLAAVGWGAHVLVWDLRYSSRP
ncbi:hypothetical protein [Natronobeatus ordinarius]|uniref:hypothetical protein n=1 Tax=Natronobeatus ordinarius TaxID=2963433 RepID=UPI0020CBF7B0|nr:hypothetical protein [Natronobeatus ordinarius]